MKIKKSLSIFILIATVFFLVNCAGVPIPEKRKNYVGIWESLRGSPTYMLLVISSNGQLKYKRVDMGRSVEFTAPIREWHGKNFKAGIGTALTEFKVNRTPYKSKRRWYMVVDGVKLLKYK